MNKRNTLVGPQLQRGRAGFNPDWKRLIAFVAVIVLGSIVATQMLANSYRFHPALGFNLFHVYPPWSYFLWSHQWEQPSNHSLFAQAFGIGSLVTLGGFMLLLLDVARANSKVNPFLHGSARWADRRDIKAAGLCAVLRANPKREGSRPHFADSAFLAAKRVREEASS